MSARGSIWYIHPYAGGPGIGRYDRPFHLARHWGALGWRSVILSSSNHHLLDAPKSVGVERVQGATYDFVSSPTYSGNGLGRLVNMGLFTMQLIRQASVLASRHGEPGLVIASSPHPYAYVAARRIARKFNARCVFEVRDLWPLSLVQLAGVSPRHPLVRVTGMLERHAYRTADAVVSLLPCTLPYMQSLGLDVARWHYIPNGVDASVPVLALERGVECVALARRWRAEGRTVVCYAGAIGRPNHVESLVHAIALLKSRGGGAAAIIVGRGELQQELRELVVEKGVADRVMIFDQISKAAVMSLLRESSAGYISLRPEPLFSFGVSPNKLFDYMLASLPVVFAVRAGNDPVTDSGCGVSTDPGDVPAVADAIASIAAMGEAARRKMGARGRAYVLEHHDYAVLAHRYLGLMTGPESGLL